MYLLTHISRVVGQESIHSEPVTIAEDFSSRLKRMGVAETGMGALDYAGISKAQSSLETYQAQSIGTNATLVALQARKKLQEIVDQEFSMTGTAVSPHKQFLDSGTLSEALMLREDGAAVSEIESRLRLKPGVLDQLGYIGTVAPTTRRS
jgi:predicted acetyltransferase